MSKRQHRTNHRGLVQCRLLGGGGFNMFFTLNSEVQDFLVADLFLADDADDAILIRFSI